MTPTYAFFAYKPHSSDTCKGCLLTEYMEETVFEYELFGTQVIRLWADVLSHKLGPAEAGFETPIILRDGLNIQAGSQDYDRMLNAAKTRACEIIVARTECERIEAEKTKAIEEARREERDRALFDTLKKKFESKEK
jgi:hypothetical protein